MWVLVVSAIFGLYDNPPRKTQAEINKQDTNVSATPTESKPVAEVVATQPKVEEKAPTPVAPPKPQPTPPKPVAITGTKTDWMRAAGIPENQWTYVDYIVSRESSWNPNAVNRSSGACGLAQALPCSKIPGQWNDPVNALKWQYGYVTARYGGYAGAYEFWRSHHWY